jgi:hypothetical protein
MRILVLATAGMAGCQASDDVTHAVTDGGTWTVDLREVPAGPGTTDLALDVTPAGGQVQNVVATMAEMGHTSDGSVEDLGQGAFTVTVDFTMSGWWVLDGEVADAASDAAEAFRLEFEVP